MRAAAWCGLVQHALAVWAVPGTTTAERECLGWPRRWRQAGRFVTLYTNAPGCARSGCAPAPAACRCGQAPRRAPPVRRGCAPRPAAAAVPAGGRRPALPRTPAPACYTSPAGRCRPLQRKGEGAGQGGARRARVSGHRRTRVATSKSPWGGSQGGTGVAGGGGGITEARRGWWQTRPDPDPARHVGASTHLRQDAVAGRPRRPPRRMSPRAAGRGRGQGCRRGAWASHGCCHAGRGRDGRGRGFGCACCYALGCATPAGSRGSLFPGPCPGRCAPPCRHPCHLAAESARHRPCCGRRPVPCRPRCHRRAGGGWGGVGCRPHGRLAGHLGYGCGSCAGWVLAHGGRH